MDGWSERYLASHLALSEDGRLLVAITEDCVYIYDAETRQKIHELVLDGADLESVDISKDSRQLLLANSRGIATDLIIDIHSGEVTGTFYGYNVGGSIIHSSFGGINDEYIMSGNEGMLQLQNLSLC